MPSRHAGAVALDRFRIDVVDVDLACAVWMPAWISASDSDLYDSVRSTYLPTIAMSHLVLRMLERVDQLLPASTGRPAARWISQLAGRRSRRGPARAAAPGSCRCESTSTAEITASAATLVNSAILRRSSSGSGRSARHSTTSGWMPISRSSFTECCVGLVLISPADGDVRHQRQVDVADVVAAELRCPSGGSPRGTAATRCRRPCRRSRRSPPRRRRRRAG